MGLWLLVGMGLTGRAEGQPGPAVPAAPPAAGTTQPGQTAPAVPVLSEAEQITRLQRSIEEDSRRLAEQKSDLQSPTSEYRKAETEFQQLDGQLADKNKDLERLRGAGKTDEAAALTEEIQPLQKQWQLAKDRFQLAIEERKALQTKLATLEEKVAQDKLALAKLQGEAPPADPPPVVSPPATAAASGAARFPPTAAPTVASGSAPGIIAEDGKPAGNLFLDKPASQELASARAQAQQKSAAVELAAQDLEAIETRIAAIKKSIAIEQELRATARKKQDNATETEKELVSQMQRRMVEGAPQAEVSEYFQKISEAKQRYREALQESRQRTDTIDEKRSELDAAQAERFVKAEHLRELKEEHDAAERSVAYHENPFNLHNVTNWVLQHGPNLVMILLGMYALTWLSRRFGRRIFNLLLGGQKHGSHLQRENRAETLAAVFQNATSIAITTGAALMLFKEIGIDVTVLMGGVAVFGLAVAFGAQNLIKDYFTGFMILLENQYALNDVVKVGDISGQVEQITLRLTVLRDLEGNVHFIPNGNITSVTNMTHGWSRAVFDVGVAYKEDIDDVMAVLIGLGKDLRKDSYFGAMILEDPTMLGVDQMADSAVMIKFYIKTRPLKQWEVKRELLRQIKNRFDELGIEIPFPHRTIYHHRETNGDLERHNNYAEAN